MLLYNFAPFLCIFETIWSYSKHFISKILVWKMLFACQRILALAFRPQLTRIPFAISVSCFTLCHLHGTGQRPYGPFCFNLRGWWSSVERPIYRQLNSAHLSPIMYKTYDTQHLLELLHIRSTYMSNELASH